MFGSSKTRFSFEIHLHRANLNPEKYASASCAWQVAGPYSSYRIGPLYDAFVIFRSFQGKINRKWVHVTGGRYHLDDHVQVTQNRRISRCLDNHDFHKLVIPRRFLRAKLIAARGNIDWLVAPAPRVVNARSFPIAPRTENIEEKTSNFSRTLRTTSCFTFQTRWDDELVGNYLCSLASQSCQRLRIEARINFFWASSWKIANLPRLFEY